jgi:hypothetical protein
MTTPSSPTRLARVSPDRGLVWQRVHDDLTARVSEIAADGVWLPD